MNNISKEIIMKEIESKVDIIKKVSPIQYIIRCPICGDSTKHPDSTHCYIKCPSDPKEPLQYNCFLCNNNGVVNKSFLRKIGLKKNVIDMLDDIVYNKISSFSSNKNIDISNDIDLNSPQIKYIEKRLGKGLTIEDYKKFRIVSNIDDLKPYITSSKILHTLPSNQKSISFLTNDNRILLTRNFSDDIRWMKKTIINSDTRSIYTIKSSIDLFSSSGIVVNIAEGVFDVLSIYKNFRSDNSVYIATLGSEYINGIEYAISTGIIGSNIEVNIYIDNTINLSDLKNDLKKYKWLFKNINIYENILEKDVGTKIEKIELRKV